VEFDFTQGQLNLRLPHTPILGTAIGKVTLTWIKYAHFINALCGMGVAIVDFIVASFYANELLWVRDLILCIMYACQKNGPVLVKAERVGYDSSPYRGHN
jgi:hypothetical protein